jgi:UDP-N-acetylglucosamine:LPS N-acetylglucosamine transferase
LKQSSEPSKNKPVSIGLFFSDTGGGHRSATEAIEAAIQQVLVEHQMQEPVSINVDALVENSHWMNRCFVEVYNHLLRNHQHAMSYYYWFIETFKPNDSEMGWRITRDYLKASLVKMDCQVAVSVHPMTNQYLARGIKELKIKSKTKLITVVTDPNGDFWSGWACKDADLTVVPNDLAKNRLIQLGVEPEKIKIVGMPIHPDFLNPPNLSADEFKRSLGLDPTLPTICVNAGWAGGGNMTTVYKALNTVKRKVQVVFLCGHNQELYAQMKREAKKAKVPTAVLPFHDKLSDLMASCDLMVTKAGGLTSFEAIARRLPMAIDMITTPMPQEMGTANMLIDQGLAKGIYRPQDIVDIVENMPTQIEFAATPLPKTHQLNQTDAIFRIAHLVLEAAGVELKPSDGKLLSDVNFSDTKEAANK